MSILIISASPGAHSRSAAIGDWLQQQFQAQGVSASHMPVRQWDAVALAHAQFQHPDVQQATQQVAQARAVVVITPLYKAAYSGLLKVFLDVLPQTALKGKTVLPVATGGSPHHMLAIDYALRPVLQALGAEHILQGIYALESQVQFLEKKEAATKDVATPVTAPKAVPTVVQLDTEIAQRLQAAVQSLCGEKIAAPVPRAAAQRTDQAHTSHIDDHTRSAHSAWALA